MLNLTLEISFHDFNAFVNGIVSLNRSTIHRIFQFDHENSQFKQKIHKTFDLPKIELTNQLIQDVNGWYEQRIDEGHFDVITQTKCTIVNLTDDFDL